MPDDATREWAILSHCALRFDGYKYAAETQFTVAEAIEAFYRTGTWRISAVEQLATFALMLRSFRWGGDGGAADGQYWRALRDLFLKVYANPVPDEYRTPWSKVWERDYLPQLEECVALVRRIHESTHYTENAGRANYVLIESSDDIDVRIVETDGRDT